MGLDVTTLAVAKAYTDKKVANSGGSTGGGGGLPTVGTADNGKFLQVVNGAWTATEIPSAENSEF